MIKESIEKCNRLFIYGAGIIGYGVYEAVRELYKCSASSFIVSDSNDNPKEYAKLSVITISEYCKQKETGDLILVATPPEYHETIVVTLKLYNCNEYILITPDIEYSLMGSYFKQFIGITCIEDIICTNHTIPNDTTVYMAISHKDKLLTKQYIEPEYVKKIQVGKANTDFINTDADCFDNVYDNISELNSLYGELTATYEIWKNYKHDITGIFHYRRILDVTHKDLCVFNNGVDVILPLPFVCYPDSSGQYGRYLCNEDIEIMKDVLYEMHPELEADIKKALNGKYLYNYNMLIARKEVFNDYCEWLFPMLSKITKRCEESNGNRFPRYIGRIGEVLTSLYFSINIRKWKITHAPKIWRV